jgi:hypothetical protein
VNWHAGQHNSALLLQLVPARVQDSVWMKVAEGQSLHVLGVWECTVANALLLRQLHKSMSVARLKHVPQQVLVNW